MRGCLKKLRLVNLHYFKLLLELVDD